MQRVIEQVQLMQAGLQRLPDDYDKSDDKRKTYDIWYESWEKVLSFDKCSVVYMAERKYNAQNNTWELVSEDLTLWIQGCHVEIRKDLAVIEELKKIILL